MNRAARRLFACMIVPGAMLGACGESTPPAPPAASQGTPAPASTSNAADQYRACFARVDPDLFHAAACVLINRHHTQITAATDFRDFDDVARVLAARQDLVRDLIEASKADQCDFGLRPGAEAETQAVELCGHLRIAARVLNADAARLVEAGDPAGAAERLGAIYGLASQVADEPVLSVTLVNAAVLELANHTVVELAAAKGPRRLRPEDARALEAAIARLDPDDPAGMVRAQRTDPVERASRASMDRALARVKSDVQEARKALARLR